MLVALVRHLLCLVGVPTYSAAIGSPSDLVIVELEVVVEDGGVELDSAVEAVAYALPIRGGF